VAYVLTYTNLVTNLQNYLQRTDADFLAEIPLFIMLGQRRVARDLKILGMRVVVNGTLTPGVERFQKPTRWFNTSTFNIGTGTGFNTIVNLPLRSYEYCNIYWPNPTLMAQPKYFSDYDFNNWYLAPTPDVAYPFEIAYFQVPVLIDETVSTNFMTESCPDILLYACLVESAPYLKDDDRIPSWFQYYTAAKDALNKEDLMRLWDNYNINRQEGV
jgi:hypothetical protein